MSVRQQALDNERQPKVVSTTQLDQDSPVGLFDGTPLERPITCERCGLDIKSCQCSPPPEPEIDPLKQRLQIRLEKRKRGKTVTVISGFGCSASQLKNTLTEMKNLCGAGGTIDEQQIELQGDHTQRLQHELPLRGYQLYRQHG